MPGSVLEKVLVHCEEEVCYRRGSYRAPPVVRGAVRKTVYAKGKERGWGNNTYRNRRSILPERRRTRVSWNILSNPKSGIIGVLTLTLTLVASMLFKALRHSHRQQKGA